MSAPLLELDDLHVRFGARGVALHAVQGVSLSVRRGEVLGIVGESGSGKSVGMLAVMGLVDPPGQVQARALRFDGIDLLALDAGARRRRLGGRIAMIFQDPSASLDPCYTVGQHLLEVLRAHAPAPRARLRQRALELLRQVEIPDPGNRLDAYPHQLSGGMCQRVMIALGLASDPELLIADEPTTALDVTIQAQVIALLRRLQRERGMALVFISHDLALVAEIADRVAVMYAGVVVELQRVPAIFARPLHPYTRALLDALPEAHRGRQRLAAWPGSVPGRLDRPVGCLLAPRCGQADARCRAERPLLRTGEDGAAVACHRVALADVPGMRAPA